MKEEDVMGMRHIDFVPIPANSEVLFKPRDLHVMLINTMQDLAIGDSGNVTLEFKGIGSIEIRAVVRDMPRMNN